MIVAARMKSLSTSRRSGTPASPAARSEHAPALAAADVDGAFASWYDDAGETASGRHYPLGFASLLFGSEWGRRVRFCYRGCAIGELDDHGPYVSGRSFDLGPALKAAIGCPDLCYLRWEAMR